VCIHSTGSAVKVA